MMQVSMMMERIVIRMMRIKVKFEGLTILDETVENLIERLMFSQSLSFAEGYYQVEASNYATTIASCFYD